MFVGRPALVDSATLRFFIDVIEFPQIKLIVEDVITKCLEKHIGQHGPTMHLHHRYRQFSPIFA